MKSSRSDGHGLELLRAWSAAESFAEQAEAEHQYRVYRASRNGDGLPYVSAPWGSRAA